MRERTFERVVLAVAIAIVGCARKDGSAGTPPPGDAAAPLKATSAPGENPQITACVVTALSMDPSGEVVVSASLSNGAAVTPTGALDVAVLHAIQANAAPADTTTACGGSVRIEPASYAADKTLTVRVKVSPACPAAPEGEIVFLKTSVRTDGWTGSTVCEYRGPVPAALGGGDLSVDEQARRASKSHSLSPLVRYVASVTGGARTIDPMIAPRTKKCPSRVSGPATVMPYELLARLATTVADAGALPAPAMSSTSPIPFVGGSKLAELLARDDRASVADEILAELRQPPPFVVIATTLRLDVPEIDTNDRRKGRPVMLRGSRSAHHHGGLFVVDREQGEVLCSTVVSSVSGSPADDPDPMKVKQALVEDFKRQTASARKEALTRVAPGLVIAP